MKKSYPKVVKLKKTLMNGAIAIVAVIVVTVVVNIYRSSHHKTEVKGQETVKTSKVKSVAPEVNWYQNQVVRKYQNKSQITPHNDSQNIAINGQTALAMPASVTTGASEIQSEAKQKEAEKMQKIMSASISSNQINIENKAESSQTSPATSTASAKSVGQEESEQTETDQNMQSEKKVFLQTNKRTEEDYLQEGIKNPVSPYELKAGTVIPAVLITGINSDLPGQITAQVRSNVYDTIAGKYVLIPQGSKMTGLYDSQVAYGQSRVLVVWKRIIYPNGQSISLEGMPGVDLNGYAGFNDQVNNHYMKIFGSVILMSVISAGAQLSQPDNNNDNNDNPTINQTLAQSLGTNIMNSANMILQKNLGIQPTLIIRQGYLMNISVTKDMVFPGAYDESTSYAGE
jgi:type IV secretion system protein TrbI